MFCFAEGTLILPLVCLFVCIFPSRKPIADPATVIPLFCKAEVDTHVGAGVVTLAICPSQLDVTVLLAFPSYSFHLVHCGNWLGIFFPFSFLF